MADSPVFEFACDRLQEHTDLDRLEARGTLRLALKDSGLDASSVDGTQMATVMRRVVPAELERRGIAEAPSVCAAVAESVERERFDVAADRASVAAGTMARFGS